MRTVSKKLLAQNYSLRLRSSGEHTYNNSMGRKQGTNPVAIVGVAHRLPGPNGASLSSAELWQALLGGADLVTRVDPSRWAMDAYRHPRKSEPGAALTFAAGSIGDVSGFDAAFFGISPREAAQMDPQQRLLLEMAWEAFESAGIAASRVRGARWGVYVGLSNVDYAYRRADDLAGVDATTMTGNAASIAANRISYCFDLRGPSMVIDTACSSSLVALHQACQSVAGGESAGAVVGGISLHLHPYGFVGFSKASMLSPQGRCRVFGAEGDGYVRSEGGALVLLKPLAQAVADGNRILAVIAGSGVNSDGHKHGLTVPSHEAQAALLRQVYEDAGIAPAEIDYLEAHGTGTAVGDPIETRAIGAALGSARPQPLPIGSVKSNLGHLETAAGMAGLVKALLTIEHRCVPATIHLDRPNPQIAFGDWNLAPVTQPLALDAQKRLVVGVNSFGFGGANAHVILTTYGEPVGAHEAPALPSTVATAAPSSSAGAPPLLLSARGTAALRALAGRMAEHLREHPEHSEYDIAYSAAFHRDALGSRLLARARDRESLAHALAGFAERGSAQGVVTGTLVPHASAPAFVYSGNGAQWAGMGTRLLEEDETFRRAVEEVDALFQACAGAAGGASIVAELQAPARQSRLELTEFAQPALFAMQVGLTRMLQARGVRAAAACGHSVGEVAAAWASGALSLAQAVEVIAVRSREQARTRGAGQMTAVSLGGAELQPLLESLGLAGDVVAAGFNSPVSSTAAGSVAGLCALEAELERRRVACKRLRLKYAFHAPAMDPIRAQIEAGLARLAPRSTPAFYSTVTGAALDGAQLGAAYWWLNVREPVRLHEAVAAMMARGINTFVEIGPDAILRTYLNQCAKESGREALVASVMQRADGGAARAEAVFERLVLAGAPLDRAALFPRAGRFVDLPLYPWQRERHWLPVTGESLGLLERRRLHPLLGYAVAGTAPLWENHLDTAAEPVYADHAVGGATVLPAAGFVEMLLAAAQQWNAAAAMSVEDLEIVAPLVLHAERSRTTQLQIDPADGRCTIRSRERASADPWVVHATARLVAAQGPRPAATGAAPAPATDIDAATHYALARELGLQYGPAFQSVAGVQVGNAAHAGALPCLHGTLLTPPAIEETAGQALLHPSYLDGAFQLLIDLARDEGAASVPDNAGSPTSPPAYLPVRIERVQVFAPHQRPAAARATVLQRGPRSLVADFLLLDAEGQVIALVQKARFRAVALARGAGEPARALVLRAVPMPRRDPARRAELPAVEEFAGRCARRLHAPARAAQRWRYADEVEPLLDVLCAAFAERAVRALAGEGPVFDPGELIATGAVAPDAESVLLPLLQTLAEHGTVEPAGARWRWTDAAPLPQPEDVWASLIADYPEHAGLIGRVGSVGLRLGARLRAGSRAQGARSRPLPDAAAWLETCTRAQARQLLEALSDVLGHAVAAQPPGGRLRALCLAAAAPLEELAFPAGLDPDRCEVVIGAQSPELVEAWRLVLRDRPELSVRAVDLDGRGAAGAAAQGAVPLDPAVDGPFDVLVLGDGLAQSADPLRALAHARQWLADGGLLVVLEQFPSRPIDFVFGSDPRWWQGDGQPMASRLRAPSAWCEALAHSGFVDATTVTDIAPRAEAAAPMACGPYLLLARAGAAAAPEGEAAPAPGEERRPMGTWIVLQDAAGYAAELGEELENELSTFGHEVVTVVAGAAFAAVGPNRYTLDPAAAGHWELLLEALRGAGCEPGGWVHLHGLDLGSAQAPLPEQVARQQGRVAALCAWLQAGGAAAHADTWVVGAHASVALLPEPARRRERGAWDPQRDAGLWGATRVAMNEFGRQRIRWVDLADPYPCVFNAALLVRELMQPDAEDEIFLAHDGRYVPRLGLVPIARTPEAGPQDRRAGVRLGLPASGSLASLTWERFAERAPGPGEVEIAVRAAGLNFRDVMYAIGLLPDEALESGFSGPTLGMELSGVVTRVGPGVDDPAPGAEVLAFAPSSFANRVITRADAVVPKPAGWSFAAGASVPTAYFTAYYALHELARLREGERVLIHGAAGGVGIAAIQCARYLGAEVLATAGSAEKRDFVRLMGAQHAFDSRSLSFADEVLRVTGGQGVDVILNSLAGEAVNRNLRILRPFGRLLELGKRDFYENTRIGLRPFRNNIAYFGIDADQLMAERPDLARRVLLELLALFGAGSLHPLPHRTFAADEIATAFRTMRESRQIGKIVVSFAPDFEPPAAPAAPAQLPRLRADASYLVTGGLSGFGLRTAQWLAGRGARHLVLVSRRGARAAEDLPGTRATLAQLAQDGVAVRALACDVTDAAALEAALDRVRAEMPPLRGVVHAAMVMDDALIRNLDAARLRRVFEPKVLGARNLDRCTRGLDLDFFLLYSSATTLFGNPGQANYVAANVALEALAQQRRAAGLPATCVCWGPIADAGYLADNGSVRDALVARLGAPALGADEALNRLGEVLAADSPVREANLGLVGFDWNALARVLPGAGAPKFAELARRARADAPGMHSAQDLRRQLDALEPGELAAALGAILCQEIGAVLRIAPERIDTGVSLFDLGMDSLMAMELAMALEGRLNVKLPLMALSEGPTVERLVQRVFKELRPAAGEDVGTGHDTVVQGVQVAAAQHAGELGADALAELSAAVASDLHAGAGGSLTPTDPGAEAHRGDPSA
jgi:phthiocerol/phenolphthiocerol synthesis type-I polyketide synthase C